MLLSTAGLSEGLANFYPACLSLTGLLLITLDQVCSVTQKLEDRVGQIKLVIDWAHLIQVIDCA